MMIHAAMNKTVKVILDTDIGPDCDDAGAMAVLHNLSARNEADIMAVMHCTSSPWGSACIDAINTYYRRGNIPVGTLKDNDFLDHDEQFIKYNRYIARNYPNKYLEQNAEDAVLLYRTLLSAQEKADTVLIAIGPLRNVKNLLLSGPDAISKLNGIDLVKEKVLSLVVMGGCFLPPSFASDPATGYIDVEWNIQMDVEAAKIVVEKWPTPIDFCGFEIGFDIITGSLLKQASALNPVKKAYELHTPSMQRCSWDPVTVLYGVRGAANYWETSNYGSVIINDNGKTTWQHDDHKKHRYLIGKAQSSMIRDEINLLMTYEPDVADASPDRS